MILKEKAFKIIAIFLIMSYLLTDSIAKKCWVSSNFVKSNSYD